MKFSNNYYEDRDIDYVRAEWEDTDEKCPECNSNKMSRQLQANGPDDYDYIYECKSCGATQSS